MGGEERGGRHGWLIHINHCSAPFWPFHWEVLGNVAFRHKLLFAPESPERVTLWLAINRAKDVTDIQAKGQD